MTHSVITSFNIGMLPADLPGWFNLPVGHPYARVENLPIQFYLIRLPGRFVLVDAPSYRFPGDDSMLLPEFKGRTAAGLLTESGVSPESITDVLITHPHLDHTLGLVDDLSMPVFPQARHYLSAKDWQNLANMEDVERHPLEVVEKAGLLTLVVGSLDLGDGLTLLPAAGETPGHQIVCLKNNDGESYIVGDLFHHPLEFAEAERCPVWADAEIMRSSKSAFVQRAAVSGAKVYFTHIEGAWTLDSLQQPPAWKKYQS